MHHDQLTGIPGDSICSEESLCGTLLGIQNQGAL